MCVSDGKASIPITCRTSSSCPPSAWLKCFLACLTQTETQDQYTVKNRCSWCKLWWSSSCGASMWVQYLTASMRLFCLMSSMNSWILRLNSRQLCHANRQKRTLCLNQLRHHTLSFMNLGHCCMQYKLKSFIAAVLLAVSPLHLKHCVDQMVCGQTEKYPPAVAC